MLDFGQRNDGKYRNPWVPGLITSQRAYEFLQLVKIYKALKPMRVLEIGSQEGGTLYHWIRNAERGCKVMVMDIFQNLPSGAEEELTKIWYGWAGKKADLHVYSGKSQEPGAVECAQGTLGEIDFLFIDGDHTYEGAKADFLNYGPLVREGGIIAFHDLITPKHGRQNHIQIGKLWNEIKEHGYVTRELYSMKDQDWGGIGVVYV
jgi:cephalosporin hydroxylase